MYAQGRLYRLKNTHVGEHCLLSSRTMNERKMPATFCPFLVLCVNVLWHIQFGCVLPKHDYATFTHSQSMLDAHIVKWKPSPCKRATPSTKKKPKNWQKTRIRSFSGTRDGSEKIVFLIEIHEWLSAVSSLKYTSVVYCVCVVSKSSKQTINRNNMKEDRFVL